MREDELLTIIKSVIGDQYIGDDCAYIKELGIVVSQDSLVEDIHFSLNYFTPYQLGYKSATVNISDILASGGLPKYLTISLSFPKHITNEFVKEFYSGINQATKEYGDIKVIGGDLTGAEKIMVSITAIGCVGKRKVSSRSNAQTGQVIVTTGEHGSSGGGLKLLQNGIFEPKPLVESHLCPKLDYDKVKPLPEIIKTDYAMMDSSDGLVDTLFKIGQASNKTLRVDFDKLIYNKELEKVFPNDYKELILYGGEDYRIIATVPKEIAERLNLTIIGEVEERQGDTPLIIDNCKPEPQKIHSLNGCYEHF